MEILLRTEKDESVVEVDSRVVLRRDTVDDDSWYLLLYTWIVSNENPKIRGLSMAERIALINGDRITV